MNRSLFALGIAAMLALPACGSDGESEGSDEAGAEGRLTGEGDDGRDDDDRDDED